MKRQKHQQRKQFKITQNQIPNSKARASGENHRMTCFVEQKAKKFGKISQRKLESCFCEKVGFSNEWRNNLTNIKYSLCHAVYFR